MWSRNSFHAPPPGSGFGPNALSRLTSRRRRQKCAKCEGASVRIIQRPGLMSPERSEVRLFGPPSFAFLGFLPLPPTRNREGSACQSWLNGGTGCCMLVLVQRRRWVNACGAPPRFGVSYFASPSSLARTALPLLHFGFERGQCFLQQGHVRPSSSTAEFAAAFACFFSAFFCFFFFFEPTNPSFRALYRTPF